MIGPNTQAKAHNFKMDKESFRKFRNLFERKESAFRSSTGSSEASSFHEQQSKCDVDIHHSSLSPQQLSATNNNRNHTVINDPNEVTMGDADEHTSEKCHHICSDAGRNKVVRFDASILKNYKLTTSKSNNSKFIMVPNTNNKVTGLEDFKSRRDDTMRNELNTFLRARVLLTVLEKRDPKLREQALQALRVCTISRADGQRRALSEKIESTLRLIAGEENWALACNIQRRIEKRNLKGKASSAKQGRNRAA